MTTTDEHDLVAAIALHPDEDTPRLMYADWLYENGGTVTCPVCDGKKEIRYLAQYDPKGCDFGDNGYIDPCPACRDADGEPTGYVSDDRHDRAELIRVQVEIGSLEREATARLNDEIDWEHCTGISASWCPNCGDCTCREPEFSRSDDDCPLHNRNSCHSCLYMIPHKQAVLRIRESALLQSHPEWFPVCLACRGSGHHRHPEVGPVYCEYCSGTGRIGTFDRGFLKTLTVPNQQTVMQRQMIRHDGAENWTGQHTLTAWSFSLVHNRERWPALREVRIANVRPRHDGKSWYWSDLDVPEIILEQLPGQVKWWATDELAHAALGQAVWRVLLKLAGVESAT